MIRISGSMDRHHRRVVTGVLLAVALGGVLRGAWLTADPPTHATLGIVWHDEGAWVHNARNRALWGHWRTDEWNPVFIAPVFTALESAAFQAVGIGTWQARIVPVASGLLAVVGLAAGLFRLAGTRAAILGATLLAANYVFVMWNRVALMESTMTALIAAGWAAYVLAHRRAVWGLAAGAAATLAFFSKASAAFFVAAMAADALATIVAARSTTLRHAAGVGAPDRAALRGAVAALAGLLVTFAVIGAAFVLPHWGDYQFYNWQMSVSRKPSYAFPAIVDRASWLPIVHDYFTRMWLAMVASTIAIVGVLSRWRTALPGDRLLVLWVLVGLLEVIVHDAGNDRRYVMFIPALIALAALTLGDGRVHVHASQRRGWEVALFLPVVALLGYLVVGSLLRLAFLPDIRGGEFRMVVRLSAVGAAVLAGAVAWRWEIVTSWLARQRCSTPAAAVIAGLVVASDLAQYAQWAVGRTFFNHRASIEVGRLLPTGTQVQGKLANGLALENTIKPIFVGRGFGNYEDRTSRDDVRYVLTYTRPSLGYESQAGKPVIKEVLDRYPDWRIIATFEVRESEGGRDQAALIDKFGGTGGLPRAAGHRISRSR
jgi:4-amino-4-deoxy-L-arabinose transferase-like glycosyltransferase